MSIKRRTSHLVRGTISVSAIALAIALASPASAQSDSSNVQGHVDGAGAGTKVVAVDTNTGQRSVGVVDAQGNYAILGLRPSTYRVSIDGKGTQETTLLVGQTSVVDFASAAATDAGKDIIVTGRVLREVRTSSVSSNVTPAQILNLPQNQRNFLSFAALTPGVALQSPSGAVQVQAGGTAASNVNVLLDGMSLKNSINHGGVFGQNFGIGNPFPEIAVQEYKVETQNFGAETGQVGSALISAITKTGGDHFHGSAFIEFQPKSFLGQPYFDRQNHVPKPAYKREQFGGELGGPIIPGRLTFYVAAEGTFLKKPSSTGNVTGPFPPALLAQVNIPHNFDFKQGLYFGKLTFFANAQDTFNLSGYTRRENNLGDVDGNAAQTHGRTILTHEDRYQLNWKHSSGGFLNQFNMAYDKATQSTPSVGTGPEFLVSGNFATAAPCATIYPDPTSQNYKNCVAGAGNQDLSGAIQLGAHFFNQGDIQKSYTFKDDATWRRGEHTVKFGGQVAVLNLARTVVDHFNGTYYYFNPGPTGTLDLTSPYAGKISLQKSPTLKVKDTQLGIYIQDEWKPDNHWTINAGLRWDFETNANNNKYVTPANIATALRAYQGWQARGINAEDYISNGHNRKSQYDEFQPRLGVAYDVHGDRDLVFFAGAGRYYDRSLLIEGAIETLTNSNIAPPIFFNGACQTLPKPAYCTDPEALRALAAASGFGGSVWVLNNKTRMPFSDQFDVGVRKRFGAIQSSLILSHIRSHNIFNYVRSNYYSNGWYSRFLQRDGNGNVIGCTDGGDAWIQDFTPRENYAACPAMNGQLTGFSGKLNRGDSSGKGTYTAIYLNFEKPFTDKSVWGFTSALTLQWAKTNTGQDFYGDEVFNAGSIGAFGTENVPGIDRWRVVTTGIYRAPWGITLSGTLTVASGGAFGRLRAPWNSSIVAPDGACCQGNFGGVSFPKKPYRQLDARIAKTFKMPWGHELTADFQVYNAFNWLNRSYSAWGAGAGDPPPLIENSQAGDSRSFQAGLRYSF